MKNKKLLLSFLALYSMTAAYAETNIKVNSKLDKIYKNLMDDKGVSKKDYGFLEEVLNKRNKELKDLYEQSDYIVKPEYLEWQIFFSGFYDHVERGDNTKANAKYHSDPDYNESGIQGKIMQGTQVSKEVDLGIRIPMKEVSRVPLSLAIQTPPVVQVNPAGAVTVVLPNINVPVIDVPEFEEFDVSVAELTVKNITGPTISVKGSGNNDRQAILNYDGNGYMAGGTDGNPNAILSQQQLTGAGGQGSFDITIDAGNTITGTIANTDSIGWTDSGNYTGYSTLGGTWNNINRYYVMKLVGGSKGLTLKIDDMDISYTGFRDSFTDSKFLFFTDSHNGGENKWEIAESTNITLKGQNLIMFGVQYHGGTANSGMENSGTILASADAVTGTTPGSRIVFSTIDDRGGSSNNDNRFLYFTNTSTGKIILDGAGDILGNFTAPGNQLQSTPAGGT